MTTGLRAFLVIVVFAALLAAGVPACAESLVVHTGERGSAGIVETADFDGITYFRLADLAAVLGFIRHWDPRTLSMALTGQSDRIDVSANVQFAAVSDSLVNVRRPVLLVDGAFWVPPTLVTHVLAPAADVSIKWDLEAETFTLTRLRPVVSSVVLEPREDGTAVVIGLSAFARFAAGDVRARRIRLFLPEAELPDSLYVPDGAGVVAGISVGRDGDGVQVLVTAGGNAGSYRVDRLRDPDRIEVFVRRRSGADAPAPALRDAKALLPSRDSVFGVSGRSIETVMIDPGHGGSEPGTRAGAGAAEKDVTLALAGALSDELQRRGFYVFMTRSGDSTVPLRRRAEIANLAMADVFVSLQCGAWYSGAARGFQVYYHEPPGQPAASGRSSDDGLVNEKAGDHGAGAALLWSGVQREYLAGSRSLALSIHRRLSDSGLMPARGTTGANLTVLAGCAMPAVLVEVGYLTNRGDSGLLNDASSRKEIARAIAAGIADYAESVSGREP